MNLREHKFPEVSRIDMAFSTFRTDPALLAEAKARGFYNGHTPYNRMFSTLFFKGGKLNYKKDVPEEFLNAAVPYLKAFMGSFEPKHEEKEAICALLLSELVEPTTETARKA
jgi:hypothetical protein